MEPNDSFHDLMVVSRRFGGQRRVPYLYGLDYYRQIPTLDYLMACFSQAAYVPTAYDLGMRGNAKFVPSELFQQAVEQGWATEVASVMREALGPGEVGIERVVTPNSVSLIVNTPQMAIIAFRGTVPLHVTLLPTRDLWIDMKIRQVALEPYRNTGERYHVGFLSEALYLLPLLREKYEAWGKGRPIFFTGHSLGGALAAITNRLWKMDWATDPRFAIVFGCPRFGNDVAVSQQPPILAVEHRGDPVPHVPRLGYAPLPHRQHIAGPDPVARLNRVRNHSMEGYRRAIAYRHNFLPDDAAFYQLFETRLAAHPA